MRDRGGRGTSLRASGRCRVTRERLVHGVGITRERERDQSLAERTAADSRYGVTAALTAVKLLFQPLLTWALAAYVFHLAAFETRADAVYGRQPG